MSVQGEPEPQLRDTKFEGLNEKQQDACFAPPSASITVVAPPGSGKTRVLASRIAWILLHSESPNKILALTFTNKASAELRERIARLHVLRKRFNSRLPPRT